MPTPSQIAEVLRFLPIFEQPGFKAGEWDTPGQGEPGVLIMPGLHYSEQVDAFIKVCRNVALILKDFDWSAWVDEAMSYVDRPERVDRADFETLCKLLTAHIRGERFTEGHLLKMFEKGHIVRLLRRLKELAEDSGHCSPVSERGEDIQGKATRMKTTYVGEMKKHLESYKRSRMGLDIPGTWIKNGKPYSHLLEKVSHRLNILESYRSEFWAAKAAGELADFNLHPCFHHLTSSQAMCFNLFFPYLHGKSKHMPVLLQALGLPMEGVAEAVFEKILNEKEGTAFDFFLRYKDGRQVTFEVKFTEPGFGATKQDPKHERKFRDIYSPMAEKTLNPAFCEMKAFLKNYQFLRNLIYLGTGNNSLCLFVLPKANPAFVDVEKRLKDALLPEFRPSARVVWLEDIVADLTALAQSAGDVRLLYHLDAFREKYLSVRQE